LKKAITPQTILVRLMAVNTELGTKNNLIEIGKITKHKGVMLHVDAAQGYGKVDIDIKVMNIVVVSVSGHMVYAPLG
ncbi:aminotransferase class V-fold PLP-dependent enzyme, partial [Francisella tularensis]|uniref:aminotransferase class V-fold PLP-dependent enzyme n=1 Tax=Francisella tularensis TaxID=263 RepID=UPI002381B3AA